MALLGRSELWPAVGIAEGKFPALAAALARSPTTVSVLAPGEESGFLAPLSVDLLPLAAKLLDRLHLLGLDEIGDLAALSAPALLSQFGKEGQRLWELANGIDTAPIRPRRPAPRVEDSLSFDGPVSGIDVLVVAARQLVSRLIVQLQGRAGRVLTMRAELASGRIWEKKIILREAVSEVDRLNFILKTALVETPPPGPVVRLMLRMSGLVGETGRQLNLGEKRAQDDLMEALRQLKARYGHSPIYRCVEVEPWSVIPEERHLLIESDT
jgi:nucleotidyltransferase/DNA polymerase involved in DNA repair